MFDDKRRVPHAHLAIFNSRGFTLRSLARIVGNDRPVRDIRHEQPGGEFEACTTHYLGLHPPPNMAEWSHVDSASERSQTALLAFFSYYRQTERMWTVACRDVEQLKALQGPMGQLEAYLDQVCDDLLARWNIKLEYKKSLAITLRRCLRFSTWSSLKNEYLSDKKIAELVIGWVNSLP